jgi:hypothetical protein
VKVHRSALKHGVSPDDALQEAEWSLWIEPLNDDGPPYRELRLGFDTVARLLETVVLVLETGQEMVIHAMPARKKYLTFCPDHPDSALGPLSALRTATSAAAAKGVAAATEGRTL